MARSKNDMRDDGVYLGDSDTPGLPAMNEASLELAKHSAQVDRWLGEPGPYQREAAISEYRAHINNAGQAIFEAGKVLIRIYENEGAAEFVAIADADLGIGRRTAYKILEATRRMIQSGPKVVQTFAQLPRSKVFELLAELDDSQLEAFTNGETVLGRTRDEIEAMSVRELQAAIRAERKRREEEREELEELIQKKNQKIDELDRKLSRKKAEPEPVPDDPALKAVTDLQTVATHHASAIATTVRAKLLAVLDAHGSSAAEQERAQVVIGGALAQIAAAVRALSMDFNVNLPTPGQMIGEAFGDDEAGIWAEMRAATTVETGPAFVDTADGIRPV